MSLVRIGRIKRKMLEKYNKLSQRQLRVGELFRQRLCEVFAREDVRGLKIDARLITVTQVFASPDLRTAVAYIVPLGGAQLKETVAQLNMVAPQLRAAISRGLRLKYVPELIFKPDDSFDNADAMRQLFADENIQQDLVNLSEADKLAIGKESKNGGKE